MMKVNLDRKRLADVLGRPVSWLSPRLMPVALIRLTTSRLPIISSMASFLNLALFGVECAKQVEIGSGLVIPHSSGIVIGAARIGENCTIYQGVTIGAKFVDAGFDRASRPVIGDGVILATGCVVLGGIELASGSRVRPNEVVYGREA